jgi:23S rRNA (cytidine1920-2'-O)/16S rRNA (cytidine1409-2'-O)-methyltransferase
MDVSFVSIEYLLEGICNFISDDTIFIALIKPQFELDGKRFKNGIVKDYHLWLDAISNVSDALNLKGLSIYKLVKSKIKGGDGNQEFLALIKKGNYKELNFLSIVKE